MPKTFCIGQVVKAKKTIVVKINKEYRRALKDLDAFSHIHVVCITRTGDLTVISGKTNSFQIKDGIILLEDMTNMLRVDEKDFPLRLIDIKPYLPCEDNAPTEEKVGENTRITGITCDGDSSFEMSYVGEIRNTNGVSYLQYTDASAMPKRFSEFERVVWWFDKFDDKKFRRTLLCKPPYECETKIGVFSSRSPVRPNPIALTVVKVERIDFERNRVYISGIESFDHTPFLGVIDYDSNLDRFEKEEVKLPSWAEKWPDVVDISDKRVLVKNVDKLAEAIDSRLAHNIYQERYTETEARFTEPDKKPTHIVVKGARENNLKGISVSIPYGKITAVVGVSGSGKSSLVMDTIYAECRRRMEYLNSENILRTRPKMDNMVGCMPTVMISQREIRANSNSTIGTFSGIYYHLRSIYAAVGIRQFVNQNQVEFQLTPATFSFLDLECRCPACNGKGKKCEADVEKIITFPKKSLLDGASPFLGKLKSFVDNPNANWMKGQVVALAKENGIDLSVAWEKLPENFKETVLYGDESKVVSFSFDNKKTGRKGDITRKMEGIIPIINRLYVEENKGGMAEKFMTEVPCDVCHGERLAAEGRLVTVLDIRYPIAAGMKFSKMRSFALGMKKKLPKESVELLEEHIDAIISICDIAKRLGIEYLELSRGTGEISGGEAQRLKLLSAFQNHMTGILYIFDEPSKKLSAREYCYIIDMMKALISEGNTILMVEHNMDMIEIADYVLEIGPKAGAMGGYLIAEGSFDDVISHKNTMLGRYIESVDCYDRSQRSFGELNLAKNEVVAIRHVTANNLNDVNIEFHKQALTCITGVSGSGKSTLLYEGILPQMKKEKIFNQVVLVESKISGGSSRSIIATYIGIMDEIRALYAATDAAKEVGYSEKDFSFNTGRFRCERCKGDGRIPIPYTEDSYGSCPVCHGKRYAKSIRGILWKEKTIEEVLELSIEEAIDFFKESKTSISGKCTLLARVGLAYIKLGHSTRMLSGGEAARLKIASCLMDAKMKNTLFLLDEPTCGLYFSDIDNLISLLFEIIDSGNTVVAIEHNRRFLSAADYTITMGPGSGTEGGRVLV